MVKETLENATIYLADAATIPDSYQESFDFENYMLFEVPEEILGDLDNLSIRGSEQAFLCTSNATFSINRAETSNLMLLLKQGHGQYQVSNAYKSQFNDLPTNSMEISDCGSVYLEVVKTKPTPDDLQKLLQPFKYNGPDVMEKLLTFEYLKEHIAASDQEILEQLEMLNAIEIDGNYRIIHDHYLKQILVLVMLSIEELDLDRKHLSLNTVRKSLQEHEIDDKVLKLCLKVFSTSFCKDQDDWIAQLCDKNVAKAFGHELLSQLDGECALDEFMSSWMSQVPDDFDISIDILSGLYILTTRIGQQYIRYFPKSALPFDPKARFHNLFQIRKKWSKKDMTPFIEELATNPKDLDAIILKYCRLSKVGNEIFLTNRVLNLN